MKLIIAGSRTIPASYYGNMAQHLDKIIKMFPLKVTEIVSGKCPTGADPLGEKYAEEKLIPVKAFPADWGKYGRAGGPIRNTEMAEYADAAIIFMLGKTNGSLNMQNKMKSRGKTVIIVNVTF